MRCGARDELWGIPWVRLRRDGCDSGRSILQSPENWEVSSNGSGFDSVYNLDSLMGRGPL